MEKIIAHLYERLAELEVDVIDKMDDGFNHFIAVRNDKATFVVYTTKGIYHMRRNEDKEFCFRVVEIAEHIPFNSVTRDPAFSGNFVTPYTKELRKSGRILSDYSRFFSVETFVQLLKL